jgi:hypothetical protein
MMSMVHTPAIFSPSPPGLASVNISPFSSEAATPCRLKGAPLAGIRLRVGFMR